MKHKVNPLTCNLVPGIIRFALPIMAVSMLSMLFSVADTMVIGRFGHENAVSAIGASGAIINILVSAVGSLAIGVTSVCGNLYGRGDREGVGKLVKALPLTGLILGAVMTIITEIFSRQILLAVNCSPEILADALLYFQIYFLSVPFSVTYMFLAAALQAGGDSVHPFYFELGAAVVNIILNLILVIVFDLNIFGVAIATLVSQILCFAVIMVFFARQQGELRLKLRELTPFASDRELWKIGIPASAESVIMNLTGVVVTSFLNTFPPDVIAGNTVAQSLEGVIGVMFSAFESTAVVFVAQNFGGGDRKRVKQSFLWISLIAFGLTEGLGILEYMFSGTLLQLYTTSDAIIATAQVRMWYMCLFFGLCGTMNVVNGCVRGLGDGRSPLIISILGSVVFRISWLEFIALPRNSIGLAYAAFPICWVLCTVLGVVVFLVDYRKMSRQR